ncbi:MAG TPA: YheU family protein [Alcanivoracaceae bacterium]|nr:YheU family protein [Alcanivoracaceae bacterium]
MQVPWQEIPRDTLRLMIEEFVSRDGTDYGEQEVSLDTKVAQVQRLLETGEAMIWFDDVTETVSIFHRDNAPDTYY